MLTLLVALLLLGAAGVAAFWWFAPPSLAERRYQLDLERRAGERRIDALVQEGMQRLLDEAQRHDRFRR